MNGWRLAVGLLLLVLVAVPLALPFGELLQRPGAWVAWAESARLLQLAQSTLLLVLGTLALALPVGIVGAILLYRTDLPAQKPLRFLVVLSLFVPLPLFVSGWQAALGSGGWLATALGSGPLPEASKWRPWVEGLGAAIGIHAAAALPWVIVLVGQGLCWVERELEEDALTAAGPWRVLLMVTLRRSLPAIGVAALWVALQTATEITITDMLQVRTFAEEVYTQFVRPEPDDVAATAQAVLARAVAVCVPTVILTGLLILAAARSWERNLPPRATIIGPPYRFPLGRWRLPILAVLLLGVGLLSGVPTLSLVWKAGLGGSPAHWTATRTWDHIATALRVRSRLVVDNLVAVLIGGGLIAGLALVVCWLAIGARWFRLGVLYLMAAAWALPGPVIGLGLKDTFFLLMNATGLLSTSAFAGVATVLYYGPSPVPLFWACLVRFFPCAVALLWPMVRTLPPELREAGQVEGARPWQELCYIVWPLTSLSVVRTAWAVAILSLGELGASKLVEVPGSMTFAHEIFVQMHYGVTNDVAAHCLVLLAAVVAGGAIVAALGWVVGRARQL